MINTRDLKKELNRTKNSLTIAERKLEKYNSEIDSYNNKIKDLEELNRNLKLDNEVLESFKAELSAANKKLAALTYSDGNGNNDGDGGGANTENIDGFQSMGSESTRRIKEQTNPNRPVVEEEDEEEYEKEVQNLKVKNEILEKEIDTLKIESEQTSKRLNISKDLISELKNKISDLSTKLQTSETKVLKLDEINQNKIREEVKLYKNLNEINMQLELTKEELKDKNTTVNKLSQEILTQNTEINTLQSSLQNEKALSNKLQDDYNRWIEKRESSVKDSKYIENLVKENESLINELNKFRQMTIPHLEYEVKDLKNTLLQSDMELADLKERHDMNLIDKSNLLALMNKNKLEANETIKRLESDIQKLLSSST
jgi:chromosome segregation ATPase